MPNIQLTQQWRPLWKHVDSYDEQSRLNFPCWRGSVPESEEIKQSFNYFQHFFCEEVMTFLVEQSNLFAVQCDPGKPLRVTQSELEQFVGCCMYMSIFNLPRSRMYWASNTRISQVADVMTWIRWEAIKKNLHFNDNTHMPFIDDPDRDKLFKIRPLLELLFQNFNKFHSNRFYALMSKWCHSKVAPRWSSMCPRNPTNKAIRSLCFATLVVWCTISKCILGK